MRHSRRILPIFLDTLAATDSLTAWIPRAVKIAQSSHLAAWLVSPLAVFRTFVAAVRWPSRIEIACVTASGDASAAFRFPRWRFLMKRFLGFSLAMFFALMAIALVGGDSGAVAGHGCHGRRCHGGLFARHHRCHGRERCHGLFGKHRRCHGEEAAAAECGACESAASECGSCGEVASDCGSCGEVVSSDCGSCGGGEVVSGGCAGGDCGGEGVIVSEGAVSEGVPTEAAPADEAPAAPAEPAKT
jgi:hypothetical protein